MFTFRAMNTDVAVTAADGIDEETIAASVADRFWLAELRFSRFRIDSELSRLNRSTGPLRVSPTMFDALVRALGYLELTDGLFDPAIGGALVALGYDRSFAPGLLDRARGGPVPEAASLRELRLDVATLAVERPPHVRIDLGGMIKGATVDEAASCLGEAGAIDAGGDAVLRGAGPDGGPWLVDVEDPSDPARVVATLRVTDRAVATSAPNRRRWRVGGLLAHHLIDPRTQAPAAGDLAQVTVVAPRAELADVLAKTAFLLGEREAHRFLARQPDVGAALVRRGGGVALVGELDVAEVARA